MIVKRLNQLRKLMKERGLDAYVINGTDPHQSECVPNRWRTRQWISGFSGSAGTVIVTLTDAGLWTDFRYYIQAPDELKNTGITLHKSGELDVKSPHEWLLNVFDKGAVVGVNAATHSVKAFDELDKCLGGKGIDVRAEADLLDLIWADRPEVPSDAIRDFPEAFAGANRTDKLNDVRKSMREKGADYHLVSALDEIAWVLNVRGSDVAHTPVAVSHLLIGPKTASLFISPKKVGTALSVALDAARVAIIPYEAPQEVLRELPPGTGILLDKGKITIGITRAIPNHCRIIDGQSPIAMMKCCKNTVEVAGITAANLRDGVAMVNFLHWVSTEATKGGVTELTITDKLIEFRSELEHFVEPSFGTIAGYREHGALCHYSATPDSAFELEPDSFLLVDSGGQFLDGTTDITRTMGLGPLTNQQKIDFTLVLKCHIQLAMATFPVGTTGGQLEILGKNALWQRGATYNHGPGHGIGHYLGVHEGPAGFGKGNATALKPGMVLTNEPGLYREGEYGIRIENTVVVREGEETEFGKFLRFETVSHCPIDRNAVRPELLSNEEREWFNDYHAHTLETLTPFLDKPRSEWLRQACAPV